MTQEEIKQNAETMMYIYCAIGSQFRRCQPPMQVSEETLKSLTATIYIQATKGKGGGYGGSSGGGGAPKHTPVVTGEACPKCRAPMVMKKDGSGDYCSKLCWKQ